MNIENAVKNSVSKFNFQHISDLSKEDFSKLMIYILKNFSETNEFKDSVWKNIPRQ